MNTNIFTSDEVYYQLCGRYNDWRDAGLPGVDKNIEVLLNMFAVHVGVVPVFSCEGHPSKDGGPRGSSFYIIFGVTEVGFANLTNIYSQMSDRLAMRTKESNNGKRKRIVNFDTLAYVEERPEPHVLVTNFDLAMTKRRMFDGSNEHYNCFILSAEGTWNEKVKMTFLADLLDIVTKV